MDGTAKNSWREVLDHHHLVLVDDVTSRLDAELQQAVAAVMAAERANAARQIEGARRATAEGLNQALRRIRQAPSEREALQLLADGTAPWADKTVVLLLENNQVHSLASRNLNSESGEFAFPLDEAGAIRSAAEAKDPMVSLASAQEISPALAEAFAATPGARAYLFPVVVRQTTIAMLLAVGEVVPAPLELLSETAGMKLELLTAPPAPAPLKAPDLFMIAAAPVESAPAGPATAAPQKSEPSAWERLTADEQKLHLQAQRVARVRVAELRLYNADALRKGSAAGDIYAALRPGIDAARSEFSQSFLSKSDTMVDYLHLEVLRSLAHDDDRVLGNEYPGPMV